MSNLSLKLPDSLQRQVRKFAKKDAVSVDKFVASAVQQKLAAIQHAELIQARTKRASRKKFLKALSRIPSRPPIPGDELP